jgi:DNA repair protein RecO (recombination protein O)
MSGSLKTEAVVLRSLRYGEADRILHLYTPGRGRVGAIAKGVRRTRSRFGGRLEPFFRVHLVLHEGRSELLTVTSVETLAAHARLREHAQCLDSAARACDAVARIFETGEPHPAVYTLLCNALAFRLKLLVAAGLAPQLAACAACGTTEHLVGFSAAAGGVVCSACEAASFRLAEESHEFMAAALANPLASAPEGSERALGQAERAISETLEYHAQLRLRPAAAAGS